MLCWCVLTPNGKDLLFWLPEEQLMMDQTPVTGFNGHRIPRGLTGLENKRLGDWAG